MGNEHSDQVRKAAARAQARRNATQLFALDSPCPTCEAPQGESCHVQNKPRLTLETPHKARINNAALHRTTVALTVRCPTCNAPQSVQCPDRDTPHPLRWARGRKGGYQ